jgi:hypothetical protein
VGIGCIHVWSKTTHPFKRRIIWCSTDAGTSNLTTIYASIAKDADGTETEEKEMKEILLSVFLGVSSVALWATIYQKEIQTSSVVSATIGFLILIYVAEPTYNKYFKKSDADEGEPL